MLQEDKLEPSEQLGDLLKQAGDADAALKCYRSSGATTKVIEGEVNHKHQSCPVTHTGLSHLAQPIDSHACVVSYVLLAFALELPTCSAAILSWTAAILSWTARVNEQHQSTPLQH